MCVGVTELSLMIPITNSLAFLFTVLGEWWAEGKVIGRGESEFLDLTSPFGPGFEVRDGGGGEVADATV